jgi:hypothetical protein
VTHKELVQHRLEGAGQAEVRPAADSSHRRQIERVVQSLRARLDATVGLDRIKAEVEAGFAAYSQARVRDFVPILVEADVRSRLIHPPTADTPHH